MKTKSAYRGELATPMEPIWFGLLGMEDQIAEAQRKRAEELNRRMEILREQLGVAADNPMKWFLVAVMLAERHVPGLAVRDPSIKSGAEKIWDHTRLALLVFEMNREVKKGLQIKQAAYELSKRRPWTKICRGKRDKPEALRAMFTRWRNKKELHSAIRFYEVVSRTYFENNDPGAWEESLHVLEQRAPQSNYV